MSGAPKHHISCSRASQPQYYPSVNVWCGASAHDYHPGPPLWYSWTCYPREQFLEPAKGGQKPALPLWHRMASCLHGRQQCSGCMGIHVHPTCGMGMHVHLLRTLVPAFPGGGGAGESIGAPPLPLRVLAGEGGHQEKKRSPSWLTALTQKCQQHSQKCQRCTAATCKSVKVLMSPAPFV